MNLLLKDYSKYFMANIDRILIYSELLKDEHFIGYILENAPMGIAIIDTEKDYTVVNQSFAQSIDYTVTELAGMSYRDITCPLFLPRDDLYFSKILNNEIDSCIIRKQVFKKNGSPLDIRVDVFSYYPKDSKSPRLIGFYNKSRPFYKDYFLKINAELHQMIEADPDSGILISDVNGRIMYGNGCAANFLGLSVKEITDQSLSGLLTAEHAQFLSNLIQLKNLENIMECRLEFRSSRGVYVSLKSKVLIDDTGYFKIGPLLIIILNDKLARCISPQNIRRENLATELLNEVKQLRASLEYYHNDDREKKSSETDINLSNFDLTNREREILSLVLERKTAKEIAYELNLAEITIRKHFTNLYRKFGASSREDLLFILHGK